MTASLYSSGTTSTARLAEATRTELYELARRRAIPGRSAMSKHELVKALAASAGAGKTAGEKAGGKAGGKAGKSAGKVADQHDDREQVVSRFDEFAALAQRAAAGELVMLPRHLSGNDRRLHVRQTLHEDHQARIAAGDAETEARFDKLAGSPFSFFRGTALLFYRDMAGEDARMPTVLTLGDVHPGNFGIMPDADNVPVFAVSDLDDADSAPFTWDLKRGTTAFLLACADKGGHDADFCRDIARQFVKSYVRCIERFDTDDSETDHEIRHDDAPKFLRKLFKSVAEDQTEWLVDDYVDMEDLSKKQWKQYAKVCGQALAHAHAHALSDETGRIDRDVAPLILKAIGGRNLFIDDLLRWSEEAAERIHTDHEHFAADHELGAFDRIDGATS